MEEAQAGCSLSAPAMEVPQTGHFLQTGPTRLLSTVWAYVTAAISYELRGEGARSRQLNLEPKRQLHFQRTSFQPVGIFCSFPKLFVSNLHGMPSDARSHDWVLFHCALVISLASMVHCCQTHVAGASRWYRLRWPGKSYLSCLDGALVLAEQN